MGERAGRSQSMSDPTMPAGLAALLQEPGWEQCR